MSFPLVAVDEMQALPAGSGWVFSRTWYQTGHPQSGSCWALNVGQFVLMSESEAELEVDRLGLPVLADKQLFSGWQNVGLVH